MGSVAYGEYEIPAPLVLQNLSITNVAQEMAGSLTVSATFVLNLSITNVAQEMAGALTVSATFVLNLIIVAIARPGGS